MMAFLEGLESGHKIMSTCYTGCDDTFGDAGSNGTFDNGGDGIHGADDLGLELRWHMEFDLLKEVF